MLIAEKAPPVPPKARKDSPFGSDNILRAFREACSQADSSQLAVLLASELASKGFVIATEVTSTASLFYCLIWMAMQSARPALFVVLSSLCLAGVPVYLGPGGAGCFASEGTPYDGGGLC